MLRRRKRKISTKGFSMKKSSALVAALFIGLIPGRTAFAGEVTAKLSPAPTIPASPTQWLGFAVSTAPKGPLAKRRKANAKKQAAGRAKQ
jgi:hypothetical protein